MCQHNPVTENGVSCCRLCGLHLGVVLDLSVVPYGTWYHRRTTYQRRHRYRRLLNGCAGLQNVPYEIIEHLARRKYNHVHQLRMQMKRDRVTKYLPRIASTYRLLGYKPPQITDRERFMGLHFFDEVKRATHNKKISFIVLLWWTTKFLGRPDIARFLKLPSRMLRRKYADEIKLMCAFISNAKRKYDNSQRGNNHTQ